MVISAAASCFFQVPARIAIIGNWIRPAVQLASETIRSRPAKLQPPGGCPSSVLAVLLLVGAPAFVGTMWLFCSRCGCCQEKRQTAAELSKRRQCGVSGRSGRSKLQPGVHSSNFEMQF